MLHSMSHTDREQPRLADDQARGLRVCMVTYSYFESDPRVSQYANALAERGDSVDVIALNRNGALPAREKVSGVTVHRIQARTKDERSALSYGYRILRFLLKATWLLRRQDRACRYDVIHVHNVPDFLVFAAVFPKWRGVPVILDIHDLLPELYSSKFGGGGKTRLFQLLVWAERRSAAFATHVVVANHIWRDRLASRSSRDEKCSVIRNYPDLTVFMREGRREARGDGKLRLTYPGSLNWHQGLDVAVRAFALVAQKMPEAQFSVYGDGPAKASLIELVKSLGLEERVKFYGLLPSQEIARIMAASDIAVEPKRATSGFGNEALSTKILEFMAVGVPVVASKTRIHAYYYSDDIIQYYENDDENALAAQILRLRNDPALRRRLAEKARRYVDEHNWNVRKQEYLGLVDSLVDQAKQ